MITFDADRGKLREALVYIAGALGEVGRFHASKAIYFADEKHLRAFGRPVTGDTYIAMKDGPVPSKAYDALKKKGPLELSDGLEEISALLIPTYRAVREADLSVFSASDIEALAWAVEHLRGRPKDEISEETHDHECWKLTTRNTEIDFRTMLTDVDDEIIEEAESFSAYGVL